MTVVRTAIPRVKRSRAKRADMASLVLRKPTDEDALLRIAEELNGRPVPGLRMTESEFVDWWDEDVNAEWVDGEVVLMPPVSLEQADLFGWLFCIVSGYLEHHELGKVLGPEFSIRLARQRRWRVPDANSASAADGARCRPGTRSFPASRSRLVKPREKVAGR